MIKLCLQFQNDQKQQNKIHYIFDSFKGYFHRTKLLDPPPPALVDSPYQELYTNNVYKQGVRGRLLNG